MISNTCRGCWLERAQLLRTLPTDGREQVGNRVLWTGQFRRIEPPSGPIRPNLASGKGLGHMSRQPTEKADFLQTRCEEYKPKHQLGWSQPERCPLDSWWESLRTFYPQGSLASLSHTQHLQPGGQGPALDTGTRNSLLAYGETTHQSLSLMEAIFLSTSSINKGQPLNSEMLT